MVDDELDLDDVRARRDDADRALVAVLAERSRLIDAFTLFEVEELGPAHG